MINTYVYAYITHNTLRISYILIEQNVITKYISLQPTYIIRNLDRNI